MHPEHLVFPNGLGKVESLSNVIQRGYMAAQIVSGIAVRVKDRLDADENPVLAAKYTGFHALRHFYASWCINRREDGGLGLPPKWCRSALGIHLSRSQWTATGTCFRVETMRPNSHLTRQPY